MLFPIVHNGYLWSGDTVNFSGLTVDERTHLYTSTAPIGSYANLATLTGITDYRQYRINSPTQGLINNQLKPSLSLWNIIKLMFKTYGYSIKSDFFNTPWMKSLYMYGYFSSSSTKFGFNLQSIQQLPAAGVNIIVYTYDYDNDQNKIPGLNNMDFIVVTADTGIPCYCSTNINLTVEIKVRYHAFLGFPRNSYYNDNYIIPAGTSGTTVNLSQTDCFEGYCAIIYRHYNRMIFSDVPIAPITKLKYFPVKVNDPVLYKDGDAVDFSQVIDQQIKQIDILSSVAKKFNLVFVPDPDNIRQIIIEPFNYFVGGSNDIWDYTDKLSYDSGFTIEPALNFIDSNLIFTDSEDNDYGNKVFKDLNNRIYGQKWLYGPTAYKASTGVTETMFGPEIIRQWDSQNPADGQLPNGKILLPLGINYAASSLASTQNANGSEQINMSYTGLKTKVKLFWYLGSGNLFLDTLGEVYNNTYTYKTYTIEILDSNGASHLPAGEFENVPIISHTMPMGMQDSWKINNDSACLLFNPEQPTYIDVDTFNCYTNNGAYNLFYGNRISNLYDPNTRFLSGKFYLKLSDYKNLKPNDLIKIQNQYFTWNKITGYNLTDTELTEIELIQANNNISTYPTRYFKYWYCDDPTSVYQLKTDFTNPNLLDTNFGWSVTYDHNIGTLNTGNTFTYTGYTSMFVDDSYTGTTIHYVPYYTTEISQDEYENGNAFDWTCDTMHNYIWNRPYGPYGNLMPTFWLNGAKTQTGLNLFIDCDDCQNYIDIYSIVTGSSINHGERICGKIIQTEAVEDIQTQNNDNITTQN